MRKTLKDIYRLAASNLWLRDEWSRGAGVFFSFVRTIVVACLIPVVFMTSLLAVDDGESVLMYSDGFCNVAIKQVSKEFKAELKKNKIKVDLKGRKGVTIGAIKENLQKEILKKSKRYQHVALFVGTSDLCDLKKMQPLEGVDQEVLLADLKEVVQSIQSVSMGVSLATPCIVGENVNVESATNTLLDAWSERVRGMCKELNIGCIDLRSPALTYLKDNNPKKQTKGLLSKDGSVLTKHGGEIIADAIQRYLGLVKSGLGRKITKSERVCFFDTGEYVWVGSSFPYDIQNTMKKNLSVQEGDLVRPSFKVINVSRLTPRGNVEMDVEVMLSQRGTINFLNVGYRFEGDDATFRSAFTKLLTDLRTQAKIEAVFVVCIYAPHDNDKNSPRYIKALGHAKIARELAAELGAPVVDFHALALAALEKNPNLKLTKSGTFTVSTEVKALATKEIYKFLGVLTEE